jgi:hypothetical protein
VGGRSRRRFATPTDFLLRDCSPLSCVHVRREILEFLIVQGPFSVCPVPNPGRLVLAESTASVRSLTTSPWLVWGTGRKGDGLAEQPTKYVRLSSMFNPTVESSPKWVEEVKADVCSSCSIFGQVEDVRYEHPSETAQTNANPTLSMFV